MEYASDLKSREARYLDEIIQNTAQELTPSRNDYRSPCDDYDEDDEDDDINEKEHSVSDHMPTPGTPRPGDVLQYRPRAIDLVSAPFDTTRHLPRQPGITARMRSILVSWLIEMGQEYGVSERAFHLAVTILDAVLSQGPSEEEFILHLNEGTLHQQPYFVARNSEFQALGW
jgi:hypothetical protein